MLEGGKSAEECTAASAGIFWSLSLVNRPHAADSAEGQGLRCAGGAGGAVFVFNVQKNQNNEKAPRVSLKVRETEVTLRLSLI